jgi:hypothetical protein
MYSRIYLDPVALKFFNEIEDRVLEEEARSGFLTKKKESPTKVRNDFSLICISSEQINQLFFGIFLNL